jgi:hypothetical protein
MNNIPIKYHAKIRQMIKKAREDERQKALNELSETIYFFPKTVKRDIPQEEWSKG